jgi:uncharacterized membrane protein (DUF485 family)
MARETDRDGLGTSEVAEPGNARLGLWLFLLYVVLYGGFMGLAAFAPGVMGRTPFGGVNVAILYGLGLIVAAFVLALIYAVMCRTETGSAGASPSQHAGGGEK